MNTVSSVQRAQVKFQKLLEDKSVLIRTREFSLTRGEILATLAKELKCSFFVLSYENDDVKCRTAFGKAFDRAIEEINHSIETHPDVDRTKETIIQTIADEVTEEREPYSVCDPTVTSERQYHGWS